MKIIIVGSNGQLGSDLMAVFTQYDGVEVVGLRRVDIELERSDNIESALQLHYPFDWLVDTAAFHRTDACESDPAKAFRVNVLSALALARLCQDAGAGIVYVSTDYVFNGAASVAYVEDDPPNPVNIYGISKMAGEKCVSTYCAKHIILRVASLFGKAGASGKGGNFITTMLGMARENKEIRVINDIIMSPTHTLDVARALYRLLSGDDVEYGIYHCTNTGCCSWFEFAEQIFDSAGILGARVIPVSHESFPSMAKRPLYSALDNSKISRLHAMPVWRSALSEYLTPQR